MTDDVKKLEVFAQGLVQNLNGTARQSLSREIAKDLRASQAQRITAQRNPDGTAYEPRKPQKRSKKGRIKRAMFTKIKLNRHLKAKATQSQVSISFTPQVDRIAKVHQFGLRDRVSRIRNLTVKYPERQLLGFTDADINHIKDQVIDHLAK
jgi:phage virion morphogenesis protein